MVKSNSDFGGRSVSLSSWTAPENAGLGRPLRWRSSAGGSLRDVCLRFCVGAGAVESADVQECAWSLLAGGWGIKQKGCEHERMDLKSFLLKALFG